MKLKQAIEICRNINAENITLEDKLEAIQKVLSSQNPQYALTKSEFVKVVEFLMQRFIRMPTFNVNTETIYQKEYALFGQCPECGTELSSDFNFCSNCGQALDWS